MSAKMLSRPASATTVPTGTAQATTPMATTMTTWLRLGRSLRSWSSGISGIGPSAGAVRGFGSRIVPGPHRPSAHPTTAAAPTTNGNGTANAHNATNAATASQTRAGCPRARPPTRTTAWATITSTAGATAASTAVTTVVSPALTYSADRPNNATTPGST